MLYAYDQSSNRYRYRYRYRYGDINFIVENFLNRDGIQL